VSTKNANKKGTQPTIYIVSGGSGASGRQIAETVLAQFPTLRVPVLIRNYVRSIKQVAIAVKEAEAEGGTVVHTLVDGTLREALVRLGGKHGVVTIDLMGPLLEQVAEKTGAKPLEQPGRYRKLRKDYFDRVEAIEFAVSHDDGSRPEDVPSADVVIVGVSRCGKTPLSMYLAVHGRFPPDHRASTSSFSISRTRSVIFNTESGLREMESIPSRTRKAAKSG
jgi:hypothetical protein